MVDPYGMIRKKPAPDLIRGGYRFSEEIMLKQTGGSSLRVKRETEQGPIG